MFVESKLIPTINYLEFLIDIDIKILFFNDLLFISKHKFLCEEITIFYNLFIRFFTNLMFVSLIICVFIAVLILSICIIVLEQFLK